MRDEIFLSENSAIFPEPVEPVGALKRALYLWERQPPSASRAMPSSHSSVFSPDPEALNSETRNDGDIAEIKSSQVEDGNVSTAIDSEIEDRLKHHAKRLAGLERVLPGDRRLDSPRFSLMMLNAFLGRAVSDGAILARLLGLFSISDRIDQELTELEVEYPSALDDEIAEPDVSLVLLRDEMRQIFLEFKTAQKSQHRQIVSSLSALHAAISELRTHLPDRQPESVATSLSDEHAPTARIDDLARPLIDPDRLLDPRPVLAAARAAANQVTASADADARPNGKDWMQEEKTSSPLPYRSILLGSACLGILMLIFGRDAVQFLSNGPLQPVLSRP